MTRSAMFDYVKRMNVAFGNPAGNPALVDWARVTKQCDNIGGKRGQPVTGELKELQDALARAVLVAESGELGEPVEYDVRDALCDIMVFVLGAFHIMGYDADADMQATLDGVMTRFCRDQAELDATIAYWARKGITEVYTEGQFPQLCLKSAKDQMDISGDNAPKGKFLKSVGYRKTVFPAVQHADDGVDHNPPRRFIGDGRSQQAPARRQGDAK